MLKFLRKHQKVLLAVFVSFLMLVFIAPQGFQQLFQQNSRGPVVATLNGRSVRLAEVEDARRSLEVITKIMLEVNRDELELLVNLCGLSLDDEVHWLLLVEEAKRGGFLAGPMEGRRILAEAGVTDAAVASVANPIRMTTEQGYEAVAEYIGVLRMIDQYFDALAPSRGRALKTTREVLDTAIVDALMIPCEAYVTTDTEPTAEAIRAHFERFRDTKQGAGDHGIGYTLPPRVKFVAMRFDTAGIEGAIRPDLKDLMLASPTLGDRITQISTEPVPPGRDPVEYEQSKRERIDALKEEARQVIVKEKMPRILEIATQVFQTEVHESTRGLEKDGALYRLPADWASHRPDFDAIALKIVEQVKQGVSIEVPPPTVLHFEDRFRTPAEAAELQDISMAYTQIGQQFATPAQFMFSVKELVGDAPSPFQVGVPIPNEFRSLLGGGNMRFMVTDFRLESPPDSLDEVRDTVIEDMRKLSAFESMSRRAEEWNTLAQAEGIEALRDLIESDRSNKEDDAKPALLRRVSVSRSQVSAAQPRINHESFRESVMTLSDSLDPLAAPESRTRADTTRVEPVPGGLCIAAYSVIAPRPATYEIARLRIAALAQSEMIGEVRDVLQTSSPFRAEALVERLGWALKEQK